jgi:hypothetical protein
MVLLVKQLVEEQLLVDFLNLKKLYNDFYFLPRGRGTPSTTTSYSH